MYIVNENHFLIKVLSCIIYHNIRYLINITIQITKWVTFGLKRNPNPNPDCYPNSNHILNPNERFREISRVLLIGSSTSYAKNCSKLVEYMIGNVMNIPKNGLMHFLSQ